MRVLKTISFVVIVVVLATMLAACGGAATPTAAPTEAVSQTILVATDASFPPMEFVDASKNIVGFDIDLLNAVAAAAGFKVEFKNTAWDGIFAGLEGGAYDAIISSVTINDERKQKYDFSEPYFNADQGIVVLIEDGTIKTEADLKGKTVGAQIGTTGAIYLGKLPGVTLKQYDTPDLAMLDLKNKNIDAVVVDTPVAANYALQAEQFKGTLKIAGTIKTNEVYGLLVAKGDPKGLLAKFNEGLKTVKANGTYEKIYSTWIGTTSAEKTTP